jgi:hypothetical protein
MENRQRHCWECLRRSLVCDFTRPQCKRCSTSGIVCPGYDDMEPFRLKWLPPGRVKFRNRKQVNDHEKNQARTKAERSVVPRFETITDAPVLAQAAEYCK